VKLLKESGWSVSTAADMFFERGMSPELPQRDKRKIEAAFKSYEDKENPGTIELEGMEKFFADLGVDMYNDSTALIVAYTMGAKTSGEFRLPEFTAGFERARVDDVPALKEALPALRNSVTAEVEFKKFWTWAYEYNCEPGQKSLQLDVARGLIPMLLGARWGLATLFSEWLGTQTRTVSKDCWALLLDFAKQVPTEESIAHFAEDGAWPVQIDDFVEHLKKRAKGGQGGSASSAASGGSGRR
jgi:hypothetical protein